MKDALWKAVAAHIHAGNSECGFQTPRNALFYALANVCHSAFASWERDALLIEQAAKAMRILAVDMR